MSQKHPEDRGGVCVVWTKARGKVPACFGYLFRERICPESLVDEWSYEAPRGWLADYKRRLEKEK